MYYEEALMNRMILALTLFLLSSAASAQTLHVGMDVPWGGLDGIVKVCQSEASASDVMTSWKNLGGAAATQTFRQKSDCGPRILSYKIVRVVDTAKMSDSRTITMIQIENWNRGLFYLFTNQPVVEEYNCMMTRLASLL